MKVREIAFPCDAFLNSKWRIHCICVYDDPADTRRKNNAIMMSKRRLDVVLTS